MLGRVRSLFRDGATRLRVSAWAVAQSAAAASLAFFIARVALGHERPFFAPIAAVICLSITLGSRPRRAVELVFGVAGKGGGLGFFINDARYFLRIPEVFAGIVTIALIGILVEALFNVAERRTIVRWGMKSST